MAAESALRRIVDECENESDPNCQNQMIECIDNANKLLARETPIAQPVQPATLAKTATEHFSAIAQAEPLSDEQINYLIPTNTSMPRIDALRWMARAVERAHGINLPPTMNYRADINTLIELLRIPKISNSYSISCSRMPFL